MGPAICPLGREGARARITRPVASSFSNHAVSSLIPSSPWFPAMYSVLGCRYLIVGAIFTRMPQWRHECYSARKSDPLESRDTNAGTAPIDVEPERRITDHRAQSRCPTRRGEEHDQEAKKMVFKDLSKKTSSKNTALSLRPDLLQF